MIASGVGHKLFSLAPDVAQVNHLQASNNLSLDPDLEACRE
jgi:hypothetical protein